MRFTYVVENGIPEPARQLTQVVSRLRKCTSQLAKELVHTGCVRVNRKVVTDSKLRLVPGDRVELEIERAPTELLPLADRLNIRVVFQDEWLVVAEKPAGLLTVPTPHREKHTLISLLARKLAPNKPARAAPTLFSVHRLDRDVSGLLVVARTREVAEALRSQFATRKPHRRYQAIVSGKLNRESGTIRNFLATDKDLNRHSVATEADGELAITHFVVEQRWKDATLASVQLETGRRNQIRVHFAELGHPVIGETRYRRQQASHVNWPYKRIALHASELGFNHAISGQPMLFTSPLPNEMKNFIRAQQTR